MTFGPKHLLDKQPKIFEGITKEMVEKVLTSEDPKVVYRDVVQEVEVIREVVREVPTIVEKEVIKYIEVIKEVPVHVEKIVEVEKEKLIEVIKEIPSFVDRIVVKHTKEIPTYVLVLLGLETVTLIALIGKIILGG